MNDIKNCKRCKRIFTDYIGKGICPKCKEELNQILVEVKKYIREQKRVSINEISEIFEIPKNLVLQWVHEEELELTPDSDIKLFCRYCNEPILTGFMCNKCKNKNINEMNKITNKNKPQINMNSKSYSKEEKMRFIR